MDVGALLALGVRPGNHILTVRVGDQEQTFTQLPNKDGIPVFFECAEDRVAAAVGYIDVPHPFDYVKGVVTFQGWAMTEGNSVAGVEVLIDGDFEGTAQYGFRVPMWQCSTRIFSTVRTPDGASSWIRRNWVTRAIV